MTARSGEPHPSISVVIPAYDPGAFLHPALRSLLAQTRPDWEAVVVDDGSAEDLSWVDDLDPRVRRIRQANQGLSVARNAGIAATGAPLVAFLDADDLWTPDKLAVQSLAMDSDADLALTSTRFEIVDEQGRVIGPGYEEHHDSYEALLEGCGICVSTVIVRRSVLDRVGLFDPALTGVQDWDLWLRVARVADVARVEQVLARYRLHHGGMSKNWRMTRREAREVLGRHDHPLAQVGMRRVDELASYQALDAAREAWRSRRYADVARSVGFVIRHRPALVWQAFADRRRSRGS